MNKRHYQLFALSMLIGAPLLVSLASNAVPGIRDAATGAGIAPAPPPPQPVEPGPPDPMAALPEPLAPPELAKQGPQASGSFDAAPSLNPTGIDPAIAVSGDASASAPGLPLPNDGGGGITEEQMIQREMKAQGR